MPKPPLKNFGHLIVLEGVDGAGKTTLAQDLVMQLQARGLNSVYMSFPGRDDHSLGAEVYKLHHSKEVPIHPLSLQLLHIAAHIDSIEKKIRPLLARGTNVILDRFWWSTWVYGIVAGVSATSLKALIEIENMHWGPIRPSMAFLILREPNLPKGDGAQDHQKRIEEYNKLANNERNDYPVRIIKNDASLSLSLKKILAELQFPEYQRSTPTAGGETRQEHLSLQVAPSLIQGPQVFSRLAPAKTTLVYDSYWRFAHERQKIFFARLKGKPWPWTDDPVLRDFKFTNAYRASDRVSQYLIKEVIYKGDSSPNEIFFRILIFKVFNRIETWELLRRELGEIIFKEYSFKRYDAVLSAAMARGERVYSAAYIMPSGGAKSPGGRKHSMHLRMIETMIKDELPAKITEARSMAKAFELIRAYPTIGDFLAYQYITDLNYSPLTSFSEMDFVTPGPGAFSGIHKCFSDLAGLTESEIIKIVTDRQEQEFKRLELPFRNLWGRPLQLIDCQNLFCEVDKYARVKHPEFSGHTGRTRIKQRFVAKPTPIKFWFPPKWNINKSIEADLADP
jgi:thymidylate kinase